MITIYTYYIILSLILIIYYIIFYSILLKSFLFLKNIFICYSSWIPGGFTDSVPFTYSPLSLRFSFLVIILL